MTIKAVTAIIANIVVILLSREVSKIDGIKKLRCALGLTQAELATKVSVTQSQVAQWERGAAMPNAAKLPLLAEVLGCTIDELFGRSPPGEAWDSA